MFLLFFPFFLWLDFALSVHYRVLSRIVRRRSHNSASNANSPDRQGRARGGVVQVSKQRRYERPCQLPAVPEGDETLFRQDAADAGRQQQRRERILQVETRVLLVKKRRKTESRIMQP